jgi:hypothetical protein
LSSDNEKTITTHLECYRSNIVLSKENVTEGTMKKYEKRMTIDEERKYLHKMRIRYWQAERKSARSKLLDEMQAVTGKHRKSIIRLLNGDLARKKRRRERGKSYGIEVQDVVKIIARSMDYPCSERLQPNLQWMAEHLADHNEIRIDPALLEQLGKISLSRCFSQAVAHDQWCRTFASRGPQESTGGFDLSQPDFLLALGVSGSGGDQRRMVDRHNLHQF